MRTTDFSPLYRSVVGFDRLAALLDAAAKTESAQGAGGGYPPYNIESTGENAYRIEIAVAKCSCTAEISPISHRRPISCSAGVITS